MNNKLLIKYLLFPESYINDSNYNLLKQLLMNYKYNSEGKEKKLLERLFDKLSSINGKEEFIKLLWDFDEVVYQNGDILNEDSLDLDPEELSKNREEDRELENLPFQRPNKPMSKELRELLYGKKYEPKKIEKEIIKPKKSNFGKYKSQILRYQDYLNDAEGNGEQEQLRHELFLIGKKMDKDKTLSSEEYGKLLDILYK